MIGKLRNSRAKMKNRAVREEVEKFEEKKETLVKIN